MVTLRSTTLPPPVYGGAMHETSLKTHLEAIHRSVVRIQQHLGQGANLIADSRWGDRGGGMPANKVKRLSNTIRGTEQRQRSGTINHARRPWYAIAAVQTPLESR